MNKNFSKVFYVFLLVLIFALSRESIIHSRKFQKVNHYRQINTERNFMKRLSVRNVLVNPFT